MKGVGRENLRIHFHFRKTSVVFGTRKLLSSISFVWGVWGVWTHSKDYELFGSWLPLAWENQQGLKRQHVWDNIWKPLLLLSRQYPHPPEKRKKKEEKKKTHTKTKIITLCSQDFLFPLEGQEAYLDNISVINYLFIIHF